MLLILLIFFGLVALYIGLTYNRFVSMKNRIGASIQEIGNQLKRQADLIPNLQESVKGYLKHEKEIFKQLTDARKSIVAATDKGDAQMMIDAEAKLRPILGQFTALVESNPQLRGVEAVTKLMEELRDTADKVMYSRRTLIDLTADYNISIESFPSNIVASIFGFKKEAGLKVPAEETKTPKVNL